MEYSGPPLLQFHIYTNDPNSFTIFKAVPYQSLRALQQKYQAVKCAKQSPYSLQTIGTVCTNLQLRGVALYRLNVSFSASFRNGTA